MIVKGCCRLGRHDETLSSPVRLVVMRLASGELLALACSRQPRSPREARYNPWNLKGCASLKFAVVSPEKMLVWFSVVSQFE